MFDLVMVLNQIDPGLANEVNKVLETGSDGEKWDHKGRMDDDIWEKYHSELYAVISGLIEGSAKTAFKGLYDKDRIMDGFKYLAAFQSRFDIQIVGGMLQSYLEVMKPKELKEANVVEGTRQWEAKEAAVHHQYDEKPN